jgi:hypothetical protein
VTGCAGVALFGGDTSDGADGGPGFTVNVAVRVAPPEAAEIVAVVVAATDVVVTVKVALVAPTATVRLAGTVVTLESSDSDTIAPPLGAAALKVTVPVEELPPFTLVGFNDSAEMVIGAAGGFTVSVVTREVPL